MADMSWRIHLQKNKGIAYSLGIADDVSWDEDMAQRGYDVYILNP